MQARNEKRGNSQLLPNSQCIRKLALQNFEKSQIAQGPLNQLHVVGFGLTEGTLVFRHTFSCLAAESA